MPTLLAPPPPPTAALPRPSFSSAQAPQLELSAVAFFGRTLAEYTRCFALDVPALRRRDVLDVAAGPASFVAEACARGVDAVAVDPLYGGPAEALAAQVQADDGRMWAQMRAEPARFRMTSSPSFAAAAEERRAAAQRFLADYAAHYVHGRYVGGALPRLPFFDDAFDLVLCAHLLFLHAKRFDFEWHLAACRELARVSAGEVRLHPLCGTDGRPYPKLAALRRELRAGGIESEVVRVDHAFFIGASSTLVLRKARS